MGTLKWNRVLTEQQHGEVWETGSGAVARHVRVWCDSPEDFVARCDTYRDAHGASSRDHGSDWAGTETYEEAGELARTGWREVRGDALGYRDAATAEFARTLAPRWGVEHVRSGGVFDPIRDLVGSQQCYLRPVETVRPNTHARVHRLNVNLGATCTARPEQILRAGAAVVALIDCLRVLGHSAEIVASETVRGNGGSLCFTGFLLHRANDVVDVDRLCYWLAHPSALRRHVFACNESIGHGHRDDTVSDAADRGQRLQRYGFVFGGYGAVVETPQWATEACGVTLDLGSTDRRVSAIERDGEVAWISARLAELGVR